MSFSPYVAHDLGLSLVDKPISYPSKLLNGSPCSLVTDAGDRLIKRSHLPFCSDTKEKSGRNPLDTWIKMLAQIHRLTESAAHGIVKEYPTMRSLYDAFEARDHPHTRELLLKDCEASYLVASL